MKEGSTAASIAWGRLRERRWQLTAVGGLACDLILPIQALPLEANLHQSCPWTKWEAGGSANTLITSARLGLRTCAVGAVGDDPGGGIVMRILEAEGVDLTETAVISNQSTTLSVCLIDGKGEHVFTGCWPNADPLDMPAGWLKTMEESAALFVSGYCLAPNALENAENTLTCMRHARAHGGIVCFDLGPRNYWTNHIDEALAATDVLVGTEEELFEDPPVRDYLQAGPHMVIAKDGPYGCRILTRDETVKCPGFDVEAVDTVGAGDAFAAGFIAGALNGESLFEAGMRANAVGAAAVTRLGTGSLLPPPSVAEDLLRGVVQP